MGIDREWTIDGRELAKDTTRFNPCHINHSSSRHNVARRCSRAERRVSFYAARNIQVQSPIAGMLIIQTSETWLQLQV